jgi:hypothetical protein
VNKAKRERLKEALSLIAKSTRIVRDVCDAEHDSMDNIPDSLQNGSLYAEIEANVDALDQIAETLDSVSDDLSDF